MSLKSKQSFLREERTRRRKQGGKKFTQGLFAKKAGVSQGTVSKYERGVLELSLPMFFAYCEVFKMTPNKLAKKLGLIK